MILRTITASLARRAHTRLQVDPGASGRRAAKHFLLQDSLQVVSMQVTVHHPLEEASRTMKQEGELHPRAITWKMTPPHHGMDQICSRTVLQTQISQVDPDPMVGRTPNDDHRIVMSSTDLISSLIGPPQALSLRRNGIFHIFPQISL